MFGPKAIPPRGLPGFPSGLENFLSCPTSSPTVSLSVHSSHSSSESLPGPKTGLWFADSTKVFPLAEHLLGARHCGRRWD